MARVQVVELCCRSERSSSSSSSSSAQGASWGVFVRARQQQRGAEASPKLRSLQTYSLMLGQLNVSLRIQTQWKAAVLLAMPEGPLSLCVLRPTL
jgi:hypothetical protein